MIISEQEKKRIRALHREYSIIKEQSIIADPDYKESEKSVLDTVAKVAGQMSVKWHKCSQDVKNISGPLLVYFNASWCAPCRNLKSKVFESDIFKQWVDENNVTLLSVECRYHGPPPEGECAKKCGDDTLQGDGTNITLHFNGYVGSGLLMGDEKHKWAGIPTVFLTDSKMNNIDVKIPTNFNAEEYVEELQLSLDNIK